MSKAKEEQAKPIEVRICRKCNQEIMYGTLCEACNAATKSKYAKYFNQPLIEALRVHKTLFN